MEYLFDYGLFLAQALTLVAAILLVAGGLYAVGQRQRDAGKGHIEVRHLNDQYEHVAEIMEMAVSDPEEFKADRKARDKADKKEAKNKAKEKKKQKKGKQTEEQSRKRLYVLSFDGDMQASATECLREEISAILPRVRDGDEVLLKLESPGGLVHAYGLASSQLSRVRDAGVPLTVAVDKVAASGGYMMACVADRIVAAPFAVIGSIGVLAQLPNFHRLLRKNDIDFELFTAGEYKRTVTMFGENTDKGREKFVEELEETHQLFKEFVSGNRDQVDIEKVATGEVWYGQRALEEGLVDEIKTSDAYIQSALADKDIYEVVFKLKKNWQEKFGVAAEGSIDRAIDRFLQRGNRREQV